MKKIFISCFVFTLILLLYGTSHCHYNSLRNCKIIIGPAQTVIDTIYMKFPALDSIWKPTYRYVVILPSDSTMGFYFRLVELLTEGKSYTRDNTFIICRNEDREIIEKNLPGYSIFSESLTLKRQSIFYSVKRKEDNWYILKGEKR
ncbi:MAG: hypothetical protein PARBA_02005 [Parabacteroides sp.]